MIHYVIQKDCKTRCPTCMQVVDLLCPDVGAPKPFFYICWACKKVILVGVGEVHRDEA